MSTLIIVFGYYITGWWGNTIIRGGPEKTTVFECWSYILAHFAYHLFVTYAVAMAIVSLVL